MASDYPTFANWYRTKTLEGWELQKKGDVEILDFGRSEWNKRRLETIYVRVKISLKNRMVGAYDHSCWVFSRIEDSEFNMYRSLLVMTCDEANGQMAMPQQRTYFRSEWNSP